MVAGLLAAALAAAGALLLIGGGDERGYIRPGLGDAGDRIFGTE